jgi:hypothetical protein
MQENKMAGKTKIHQGRIFFNRITVAPLIDVLRLRHRTPPKGCAVAERGGALLAVDCGPGQVLAVVVVATGPRKLENGLPKRPRPYAVDCLHTSGRRESSTK